jgi:hypothetical protein
LNRQGAKSAKFKSKKSKNMIHPLGEILFFHLGVYLGVLCALVVPAAVF